MTLPDDKDRYKALRDYLAPRPPAGSVPSTMYCPDCRGSGRLATSENVVAFHPSYPPYGKSCERCGGTGRIPAYLIPADGR